MREAVIVSAVRTPIGRAKKGSLTKIRMDDLGAFIIKEALNKIPQIDKSQIEDVLVGCAFPEGEQGMNVARLISILAGLPLNVAGVTINRFCGSSMQALHDAARAIMLGDGDIYITAGIESMTKIPVGGFNPSFNEKLTGKHEFPFAYISMGLTAENLAKKYNISRQEQDLYALKSHQKTIAAYDSGKFKEEIIPVTIPGNNGENKIFEFDDCPRRETTFEALSQLKPAFLSNGTVTAGNSSPVNDGAAAMVVMSLDKAKQMGVKPIAAVRGMSVVGVEPEYMGIGPVEAIRKLLKKTNFKLDDFDAIEINEAFACQTLAVIKQLNINPEKLNIHGGAIAIGHPLGCSGARILTTLINVLRANKGKLGLASMCIGGGQGIATIIEML